MDNSLDEALKGLTIKQLQEIAKRYQIQLKLGKKQEMVQALLQSSISKAEWETILTTHFKSKSTKSATESSKPARKTPSHSSNSTISTNTLVTQLSTLDQRVSALEIQVQQILSHFSLSQGSQPREKKDSLTPSSSYPSPQYISRVKFEITSHISPGESMTIDEILFFPSCQSLPKAVFDQIIIELIDDAVFDGTEANSHAKIQGSIGRIIRRR